MNKSLDSCLRPVKEAIESARIATTPNMPKNQPRLIRKIGMILKSDGPFY
jgi:hypothetical protein